MPRILPDGRRQVLAVWLPGQEVGLGEVGLERPLSVLHALGATEVREIGWDGLREQLCGSSELGNRVAVLLDERVTSLGRRDAAERPGLTSVHISRMLARLRDEGLVDMEDHGAHLIGIDELKRRCDFDSGYPGLDVFCDGAVRPRRPCFARAPMTALGWSAF